VSGVAGAARLDAVRRANDLGGTRNDRDLRGVGLDAGLDGSVPARVRHSRDERRKADDSGGTRHGGRGRGRTPAWNSGRAPRRAGAGLHEVLLDGLTARDAPTQEASGVDVGPKKEHSQIFSECSAGETKRCKERDGERLKVT